MKKLIPLFILLFIISAGTAQPDYFYPQAKNFNKQIPTPEQFLGYPIGSHHTRHDQVVAYFNTLASLSPRIKVMDIGKTYEHRTQITAIITTPENHTNLEDIRTKHLQRNTSTQYNDVPLIIHLGYNVHGNEPSSTEAALLTGYYLVANEDEETKSWLSNMVILLDPVYNPDGRDRHSHWANMHKGSPLVGDPLDREHNEVWPGGRTNHYWFDLNRDWFLGVHPESRNRMKVFHHWRPYVMTDHHEMGTNSTFYFDPGKYSSNNPIVPPYLYDVIYPKFGEYFATAMNSIGSQYYTKESYDKLYPGYGSSYVNFYGGAGFLFEQASSRGHMQETSTIPITFGFTIRNQFTASLATVRASLAERESILNMRINFYKAAQSQAKANPIKGYVFGDTRDVNRTFAFVNLLRLHQVEVYDLQKDMSASGKNFVKGKGFIVPTEQENYFMVRSLFEKDITYTDSTFYDASTWSLVHAFNLPHAEIRGTVTKGEKINIDLIKTPESVTKSNYAYVMDLTDYNAHKAIHQLQENDVTVKIAYKGFTIRHNGKEQEFNQGTVVIPVVDQNIDSDKLFTALQNVSKSCLVDFTGVETGYNVKGIDLGSNYVVPLKKSNVLLLLGSGVSGYEAGEIWHLMDQRIGKEITKVDVSNINRVSWDKYNVLLMVGGSYSLDKPTLDKIKAWLQSGGTLITFKTASEWAIKQGITKEKLVVGDTTKSSKRVNYIDAQSSEGARSIGGSIFQVDLDITNPIGFGFSDRNVSVYRNGTTFIQPSKNPYTTVAKYKSSPLIGGYVHKTSLPKISNSAAVVMSREGQGKVIMFSDNPNFRGIWYGTNKMFLNALFFGPVITVPSASLTEN